MVDQQLVTPQFVEIHHTYLNIFEGVDFDADKVKISGTNAIYNDGGSNYTTNLLRHISTWGIDDLDNQLYQLQIKKITHPFYNVELIISVNITKLEELVDEGRAVPNNQFFMYCLHFAYRTCETRLRSSINTILTPVQYTDTGFVYPENKFKKKLFVYQRENVKWMLGIEGGVKQTHYFKEPQSFTLGNVFVRLGETFRLTKRLGGGRDGYNVQFRGGGLLDETGIGKTLSTLALCVMNPCNDDFGVPRERSIKYKNKKGNRICQALLTGKKNGGKMCGKGVADEENDDPNQRRYCRTHVVRDFNKDYREDVKYDASVANFLFDGGLINTRATLIITPNHLSKQWGSEIEASLSDKYKVITITTKTEFERCRWIDIITADFVVVSFNFMINNTLTKLWRFHKFADNALSQGFNATPFQRYPAVCKDIIKSKGIGLLNEDNPILNVFRWWRIVVDEFHELYNHDGLDEILFGLRSKYRWVVSGTPTAQGERGYTNILKFITSTRESYATNAQIQNYISSNLFRRNEKRTIQHEFTLPPIEEINKWLEFTATERAMYNNHIGTNEGSVSDIYLRQLCCHPNISAQTRVILENCKTLDEVREAMIAENKMKITELERRLTNKENEFATVSADVKAAKDNPGSISQDELAELHTKKRTAARIIVGIKSKLEGYRSGVKYFSSILPKIKAGDLDEDPITLEPIDPSNIGMTKCGHIYDYNSLKELVITLAKCALCNAPLIPDDIFKITDQTTVIEKPSDEQIELDELINKHGTKLANLIIDIREMINTTEDQCIVFSQWDTLLAKIKSTLEKNKIMVAVCKSNVHAKNKAIRMFNTNSKCRVMLLSSENASSGVNLTKASRVYMLDPVYGSEEFRVSVECQSLGRSWRLGQTKKVQVIRYLIKNSVENEIFKLSYKTKLTDALSKLVEEEKGIKKN